MGVLKCKWADSCFKCRCNWCRKYCKNPNNNLHIPEPEIIIATFPGRIYGRYKEDGLAMLAKKLNATEAEVLKAANTEGWLGDVVLLWAKDKPEPEYRNESIRIKAFWADGSSMIFENGEMAAEYFGVSASTIYGKAKMRSIYKGVLLLKSDAVPLADELALLRYDVPPSGDIPAPTAQKLEIIARLNEARENLKERGDKGTNILCTWKTGEQAMFKTLSLAESVLQMPYGTFGKYAREGKPYRGITFTRLE